MTFGPNHIREEFIILIGYSDSDYVGNQFILKMLDFKSIAGYVFFLADGLISG